MNTPSERLKLTRRTHIFDVLLIDDIASVVIKHMGLREKLALMCSCRTFDARFVSASSACPVDASMKFMLQDCARITSCVLLVANLERPSINDVWDEEFETYLRTCLPYLTNQTLQNNQLLKLNVLALAPTYDCKEYVGHGALHWHNMWYRDMKSLSWLTDLAFADVCFESRFFQFKFVQCWKALRNENLDNEMLWHCFPHTVMQMLNDFRDVLQSTIKTWAEEIGLYKPLRAYDLPKERWRRVEMRIVKTDDDDSENGFSKTTKLELRIRVVQTYYIMSRWGQQHKVVYEIAVPIERISAQFFMPGGYWELAKTLRDRGRLDVDLLTALRKTHFSGKRFYSSKKVHHCKQPHLVRANDNYDYTDAPKFYSLPHRVTHVETSSRRIERLELGVKPTQWENQRTHSCSNCDCKLGIGHVKEMTRDANDGPVVAKKRTFVKINFEIKCRILPDLYEYSRMMPVEVPQDIVDQIAQFSASGRAKK